MLTHRRSSRPSYFNNNNIAEAFVSETASQDNASPNEITLPPSRPPSTDPEGASIVNAVSVGIVFQNESGPGQEREQPTQEYAVSHKEAESHEEAEMPETSPANEELTKVGDPYAEGQKKLAEFWPIYVKEADNFDKELSEGWNKFSYARSDTEFVLESSKALKPDPVESAAATLLLISQTLLVMSNQSALAPASISANPAPFIPTSSVVAVNVLWFTSLILSVSVTLVAMLAKEWTHLFMIGRTGVPMEQARKRQKRLDGIKAWKMEGVITALPTLMHIALFLFAGGLCVHLWNIHVGVALPVIAITSLTALIYITALVLPLIYDYCPYATALSKLIKPYPGTWYRIHEHQSDSKVSGGKVAMDATTSQALAWMISNSEVPKSVDLALQAIAGTSLDMPNDSLWECSTPAIIHARLQDHIEYLGIFTTEKLKMLEESNFPTVTKVLAYAQALNLLAVEYWEHVTTPHGSRHNNVTDTLSRCQEFYMSLYHHESLYVRQIGYTARALCFWHAAAYEHDQSCNLLEVSKLGLLALQQQDPLSFAHRFRMFTILCCEATHWDSYSREHSPQQPQILCNILAMVGLAAQKHLPQGEYATVLCAVGFAMNRHAGTPAGDASGRFFNSDNQAEILRNLDTLDGVLGLCGLLDVLKSDGLLDSIRKLELEPVFDLLLTSATDKGFMASYHESARLRPMTYLLETAFNCYQRLYMRDISINSLTDILSHFLRHHEPAVVFTARALLKHPASDSLRRNCVNFVAQVDSTEVGIGTELLSNAFYQVVQLERGIHRILNGSILRLTYRFETVLADHEGDMNIVVHALLQQLLDDDILCWLLVLMTRAQLAGKLKCWRGLEVGYVMQFWGEHLILWGRQILRRSETSECAKEFQDFFTGEQQTRRIYGEFVKGVVALKNLLWREINRPEYHPVTSNPPIRSGNRISRQILSPWWYYRQENQPVQGELELV